MGVMYVGVRYIELLNFALPKKYNCTFSRSFTVLSLEVSRGLGWSATACWCLPSVDNYRCLLSTDDKHKHDLNVSGVELKTSRESSDKLPVLDYYYFITLSG